MRSGYSLRTTYVSLRRHLPNRAMWLPSVSLVAAWSVTVMLSMFSSMDDPRLNGPEDAPPFLSPSTLSNEGAQAMGPKQDLIRRWPTVGRTISLNIRGTIKAEVAGPFDRVPYKQQLFFAFDWTADSVIESNDGNRIVELRTFNHVSEAFMLSEYDTSQILLSDEEPSLLSKLGTGEPHVGMRCVPTTSFSDLLISDYRIPTRNNDRAFWEVASLSGKSVRLTHRLGFGIERVEAVDCQLSQLERRWLRKAILDWHYGVPDESAAQQHYTTDAAVDDVMPTSMRMVPPWSQLSDSDKTLLCVAPAEENAINLMWTDDDPGALDRWFPPGHLLSTDYTLKGLPRVSLGIKRRQYTSDPVLPVAGGASSVDQVSAASLVSTTPLLAVANLLHMPDSVRPCCYVLTGEGSDLAIAVATLLVVSTAIFVGAVNVGRSKLRRSVLALMTSGLLFAFSSCLHGQVSLTSVLPMSSAIILGNWLPMGAAMLAGLLYGRKEIPQWRRAVFALGLLGVGWYAVLCTVSPVSIQSNNQFANGVCLQSSPATCSAGAAASLLGVYGIETNETEMVRLCLTGRIGTNMLGIYRGLKMKTDGTPFDVEPVCCSFAQLQDSQICPMLLPVKLQSLTPITYGPPRRRVHPMFTASGKPALLENLLKKDHCIVLYGFTGEGDAIIGDPSNRTYGRVHWKKEQLEKSWRGEGFRLVRRS